MSLPHRRYNPLSDTWIIVSPHRTQRPWQGQQESVTKMQENSYDPTCYLCPGNTRANGETNPHYSGVYIFENDFPALLMQESSETLPNTPLFQQQAIKGRCKVLCFSPDHHKSIPSLMPEEMQQVIHTWQSEFTTLGETLQWVQLFENKGAAMGCSNPHPHGQIWAMDYIPTEIAQENTTQERYYQQYQRPMLLDYMHRECERSERIVLENNNWLVVVPFWAKWPFETLVLPKFTCPSWHTVTSAHTITLADILQKLTCGYDTLFQCSFPYSMGWHCAPPQQQNNAAWQLHAHFYPPLLRSASVKKFMVGFEMLAEIQRDITPEQAAHQLRQAL